MSFPGPLATAARIAERVMAVRDRWPSYTDDLLGGFEPSILRDLLTEFVGDLVRHRGADEMWHQLVDEDQSYPESSGSGLILSMLRQTRRDIGIDTSGVIRSGVDDPGQFISAEASVENGCIGTPPLRTREEYRQLPSSPNDPHAVAAAILAFASVDC